MVRPLRIEYPEACYHVINRGNRGEQVFFKASDYHPRQRFEIDLRSDKQHKRMLNELEDLIEV
jgi:hypothetical protein